MEANCTRSMGKIVHRFSRSPVVFYTAFFDGRKSHFRGHIKWTLTNGGTLHFTTFFFLAKADCSVPVYYTRFSLPSTSSAPYTSRFTAQVGKIVRHLREGYCSVQPNYRDDGTLSSEPEGRDVIIMYHHTERLLPSVKMADEQFMYV